jgi:hypothetical protein
MLKFFKYLITILVILLIAFFILLFYWHITYEAKQYVRIYNESNEVINIKMVRIDDTLLLFPKAPLKPRQNDRIPSPEMHTSFVFKFNSNQPKELEMLINDPTVGENDFQVNCKLESEKREICAWTFGYKNINGPVLSCFCESIDYKK